MLVIHVLHVFVYEYVCKYHNVCVWVCLFLCSGFVFVHSFQRVEKYQFTLYRICLYLQTLSLFSSSYVLIIFVCFCFSCSIEEDFVSWREKFWPVVCEMFGVEATGEDVRYCSSSFQLRSEM